MKQTGDQITIERLLPLTTLTPGKYTLEIHATDALSNQSISRTADFTVKNPTETKSAANVTPAPGGSNSEAQKSPKTRGPAVGGGGIDVAGGKPCGAQTRTVVKTGPGKVARSSTGCQRDAADGRSVELLAEASGFRQPARFPDQHTGKFPAEKNFARACIRCG